MEEVTHIKKGPCGETPLHFAVPILFNRAQQFLAILLCRLL